MTDAEKRLYSALLHMVEQHCGTSSKLAENDFDSFAIRAHAEAMALLGEAGFIYLTHETGGRLCGDLTPEGEALSKQRWPGL